MKTLNQVRNIIKGFFDNHALVNGVYTLQDFDFAAERNLEYKVVNIEYIDTSINTNVYTHNFTITIADITLQDSPVMEDDVVSDSIEIAEDFITWMERTQFQLGITTNNLKPFYDTNGDRVCGIVFNTGIDVIRKKNYCDVPAK